MARYQHKRSTVPGLVPDASELLDGELALNTADGKLFYKDDGGAVQELSTGSGGSGSQPIDYIVALSGEDQVLSFDIPSVEFRVPRTMTLTKFFASLRTAQSTIAGNPVEVGVYLETVDGLNWFDFTVPFANEEQISTIKTDFSTVDLGSGPGVLPEYSLISLYLNTFDPAADTMSAGLKVYLSFTLE